MNQRTAKLIRKHCWNLSLKYRSFKRGWNVIPWTKRHELRQAIKASIESMKP